MAPYTSHINIDIAQRLKDLRKHAGLTQEQLAKAIGITRSAYGSYEEGRAEPPIPVMVRFVMFYKLDSIDHLIGFVPGGNAKVHPFLNAYYSLPAKMKLIVDFILKQNGNGDSEY